MKKKPIARQVVVITGASSGIGRATATLAVARGAKVLVASRNGDALSKLCDELGGTASYLAVDVGSEAEVDALARAAVERHGRIDTWVNVAGVGIVAKLKDTTIDDHRRLFETNYWGVVNGSRAAARHFRERRCAGTIINVGSAFSDMAPPLMGAYAASKFAVKAFTNALRIELSQEGLPVSVTLVKPSVVDSMFYDHVETTIDTAVAIPPPRYAPSVVAAAIVDAAEHARREIAVGMPAAFSATVGVLVPALMERFMWFMREPMWKDTRHARSDDSGVRGVSRHERERSGRASARTFSVTALVQRHPWTSLALALAGAGLAGSVALGRRRAKRAFWARS